MGEIKGGEKGNEAKWAAVVRNEPKEEGIFGLKSAFIGSGCCKCPRGRLEAPDRSAPARGGGAYPQGLLGESGRGHDEATPTLPVSTPTSSLAYRKSPLQATV